MLAILTEAEIEFSYSVSVYSKTEELLNRNWCN